MYFVSFSYFWITARDGEQIRGVGSQPMDTRLYTVAILTGRRGPCP